MRFPLKLNRLWGRRLLVGTLWVGVAAGAYFWGQHSSVPEAQAHPVAPAHTEESSASLPTSGRIVGYIYGNVPVTREELGEFLIARYGRDKSEHLINRRIIEHAARGKGITIAEAEVNVAINTDAMAAGVRDVREFTSMLLKRYNKTEYEWREDVIKPRLMLEKMCRARVTVTGEDLAKAFEAHYGKKVDCKLLLYPKDEKNHVLHKIWPAIRQSEKEFDHYARMQPSPSLAAVGGHIKPIGKHTSGSERLEKVLFSLRPGEVSEVLDEPEGLVILKCLGHIDAQKVDFEKVRPALEKEVFDKKVAIEIGTLFRELHAQASPKNFFKPTDPVKEAEKEVAPPTAKEPAPGPVPGLNGVLPAPPGGSTPAPLPAPAPTPAGR